jgi:hypothetical protein
MVKTMKLDNVRYSLGELSSIVLTLYGGEEDSRKVKGFLDNYFLGGKDKFEKKEWESKEYSEQIDYSKAFNNKACFKRSLDKSNKSKESFEMGICYKASKKEIADFYYGLKYSFPDLDYSEEGKKGMESLEELL